jgi:hypothetical protein
LAINAKNIAIELKNIAVQKLKNLASLSNIKTTLVETASKVGLAVATGALTVATTIGTAAMFAFNAVMSANPIALVVLGVVALIAGIALLVKKFGAAKVIGTILKVAFFPIFGVIGTFKLIGSAIMSLKGLFSNFGTAVQTYLKIAFAPFFLAYKIFQKAKDFVGGFFGGGETTEGGQKVTPESTAGKGGKVRQTVSEMTIRNGQVVESKTQTKEITMRLDKLNNTGQENVTAANRNVSETRKVRGEFVG